MTELVKIPPLRPEPARDTYGRYILPHPESGRSMSWTRATTLKDAVKDKEGLIGWKQRMAAAGMAIMPKHSERMLELHAEIAACGDDWRAAKPAKDAAKEILAELHHAAGGDEGSERGTQAHTLTEYADADRLDEVKHLATEGELADLQAYLDCCDGVGIQRPAQWIERIVVNTQVASAGTLDRLVYLPDGRLVVGDVKSQKDFAFGFIDVAAQLAQYVHAEAMWNDETQSWEPLPAELDKEIGVVFHVPVGKATCELIEVDLVQGWEVARIAYAVRDVRKRSKSMGRPYQPRRRPAPATTTGDQVLYLIASATHPDALVGLWRDLASRGGWTPEYNAAASRRKAELLGAAA